MRLVKRYGLFGIALGVTAWLIRRKRSSGEPTPIGLDASRAARTGEEPFFDRGPGYATLSGGATFNEFDVL